MELSCVGLICFTGDFVLAPQNLEAHAGMVDDELDCSYEAYVRLRSINSVLSTSILWAPIWLLMGVVMIALAMTLRPESIVVGLDAAGRAFQLNMIQPPTKSKVN